MNYNRTALKQAAKSAIKRARPQAWKMTLLYFAILFSVVGILSYYRPNAMSGLLLQLQAIAQYRTPSLQDMRPFVQQAMRELPLQLLLSGLITLFSTLMHYGYSTYALKVWRAQPGGFGDLFCMFRKFFRVLGAMVLVWLFTLLWLTLVTVPYFIAVGVSALTQSQAVIMCVTVLGAIPVIGCSLWVALRYAMVPYWIIVDPDCGVLEAIRRSKDCMFGHKRKLLALELSFLGWALLYALVLYLATVIGLAVGWSGGWRILSVVSALAAGGLALVLTAPFLLWLTAYYNVALMGFFDLLSGYEAPPHTDGGAPYPIVPPVMRTDTPPGAPPNTQTPPQDNDGGLSGTNDPWSLG